MTRDAEQQKYSEIAALASVTVGQDQFRNAEPRFHTAWTRTGLLRQTGTSRMPTLSAQNWQARRFRGGRGFNGNGVGRPPVQSRRAPLKGGDGIRGDDSDHVGGGAADSGSVLQMLSTCAKHKLPRPAKLALACCTMRTVIEYSAYSVDWK